MSFDIYLNAPPRSAKFELTEAECIARAARMDRQKSEEGRYAVVQRLRNSRPLPIR